MNNEESTILDIEEAMVIITDYIQSIVTPEMFVMLTKEEETLKEGALCLLAAMILSDKEQEAQHEFDGLPPSQYN
jgi:hypothetical protein